MAATGIKKQNSFDDIRILCCFIVIYEHCVVLTKIPYLNLDLRTPAVNVFFILSGYWVTRSYINSDSIRSYAKKRFRKIFPMLWGVVLTCAVLFSFFSTLGIRDYFTSTALYKYILCNGLTLNFLCQNLPGVFVGTYGDGVINGALWTLKIELGFYIILPILYLMYKRSWNKRNAIIGLFLISLLIQIALSAIVSHLSLPESLDNQLTSILPYFVFGMVLSVEGGVRRYIQTSKPLFFACLAVFLIGHFFHIQPLEYLESITIGVIVFFLANNVPSFIGKRENISYGMYLIHFPIIQTLTWLGMFEKYSYVAIVAVFCMSFTIICLVNFLKERYLIAKAVNIRSSEAIEIIEAK